MTKHEEKDWSEKKILIEKARNFWKCRLRWECEMHRKKQEKKHNYVFDS